MLKERWISQIQGYIEARVHSPRMHPDEVRNELLSLARDAAAKACGRLLVENDPGRRLDAETQQRVDKLADRVAQDCYVDRRAPAARLLDGYKETHADLQRLVDKRRQEDWADSKDRWKQLTYRIATAVGIAAVVLCTGVVAHRCSIPLPLLRPY